MQNQEENTIITIRKAAEMLGVSLDTLRRWDKKGSFRAVRTPGGHRLYSLEQIRLYTEDLFTLGKQWAVTAAAEEPRPEWYAANSLVFQTRLARMEKDFTATFPNLDWVSLVIAATGEIGNNSFDHNLGNWRDIPGVFYGYDVNKREVILADRGQGILTTLKRVRPSLSNDSDALHTAFTEVVSGRAPEARGNGLKLVRTITEQYPLTVDFYSGNAHVTLRQGKAMQIENSGFETTGSLARLTF
ncbi:MAG: helix-turn-helix domain-containing protein [Candidatus Moraniibacteriota bacterium]